MASYVHLVLQQDHYDNIWCYLVVEQVVWIYAMVELVGWSPCPWLQHIKHRPLYIDYVMCVYIYTHTHTGIYEDKPKYVSVYCLKKKHKRTQGTQIIIGSAYDVGRAALVFVGLLELELEDRP